MEEGLATLSGQALAILRDQRVGTTWEMNIAQNLEIWALMYLGELREVSRQVPVLLASARSRGNLYIATELCTRSNYVWLAADDPDEGEREVLESIGRWSHKGFHRQHYSAMLARIQTALYRGDAEAAWRLVPELESRLRQTQMQTGPGPAESSRSICARAARWRWPRTHAADRPRFLSVARAVSSADCPGADAMVGSDRRCCCRPGSPISRTARPSP